MTFDAQNYVRCENCGSEYPDVIGGENCPNCGSPLEMPRAPVLGCRLELGGE